MATKTCKTNFMELDERVENLEESKRTVVALADAAATLTATQLVDSGIFTMTPTAARNFTTPTAATLIAKFPDLELGTTFEFTIVNAAAATHAITLVGGTDVSIVGDATACDVIGAATSATFIAVIDSATTIKIYRK